MPGYPASVSEPPRMRRTSVDAARRNPGRRGNTFAPSILTALGVERRKAARDPKKMHRCAVHLFWQREKDSNYSYQ